MTVDNSDLNPTTEVLVHVRIFFRISWIVG